MPGSGPPAGGDVPAPPGPLPHGLGEPLAAETVLLAGVGGGTLDRIGDGELPLAGDAAHEVRAELVRLLLLGAPGLPAMREKGLRLEGAWISGVLDLEGCRIPRDIGLINCRFDAEPLLRSAVIDTLSVQGSDLPGLNADRIEARGDVTLRATTLHGTVSLRGARIGGDLICDHANLSDAGGFALLGERIAVRGGALLRGAQVQGGVMLSGARIGGSLDLSGSRIERPGALALDADSATVTGDVALRKTVVTGAVSLVTARIGGDVDLSGGQFRHPGEIAVSLNRTNAEGAFFLREGAVIEGALSLNGADLGAIVDDPQSWPAPGDLLLNRCRYGAFLAAPVSATLRLDWLARQTPSRWGEDFWPQPYEQLARVLTETGHDEDARRVLVEKERLSRRARRARAGNALTRVLLRIKDAVTGLTVGYGRHPLRALVWLGLLWASGAAFYAVLLAQDAIRPNFTVILRAPEWVLCAVPVGSEIEMVSLGQTRAGLALPGQSQLACYQARPEAAAYPRFNPMMLSVDAILPGLDTGQREAWSPDTRVPLGYAGRWFLYFQGIAGFALSLLAIAGFSGLVKTS